MTNAGLEGGFVRILGWCVFVGLLIGGGIPAFMAMEAAPFSQRGSVLVLTWLPYAGASLFGLVLVALGRIVQLLSAPQASDQTDEVPDERQEPTFRTAGLVAKP